MSNALTEIVDYISEKLTQPGKPSAGAAYLRDNFEVHEIPRLVDVSFQIIQMHFTKATSETPAGECRLTTVSSAIGNRICTHDENDGIFTKWDREVRLGDLFIEAYFNTGYVDLYYPQMRDSFHIVSATSKWTDLWEIDTETIINNLKGTVTDKPPLITDMMQMHRHEEEPVIKGRTKDDPLDTEAIFVKAINKLQRTGWKVNTTILDAMLKDYKNFISFEEIEDNKPKELKRRSKLIEWAFITKKAEHLRDQTFYQFLEADYRGRLYYSEPFLNFQGSDIARGILQFARPKPMDQHGLQWLAIHTACSYNQSYSRNEIPEWCTKDYACYLDKEGLDSISVDKMTLEDRITWTNENMDWIREAGVECKFYHEAEKTISFLACCLEWHEFHVAEASGSIHRTHLPIPIDGSNNGWQHLGAISKDTMTGELVGLVPVNIQKDFYVQTAKELYSLVDGELKDILDRMPMKHIRKGISKRGSMTRAYSAGAAKIGENMWFDCKTEDFHEKYGLTEEDCMAFAKILIKAINNVCPGPLDTMKYFQTLAALAVGEKGDKLKWTTPSGFDVVYTCNHVKSAKTKGTISGYVKYNKLGRVTHVAQLETEFPDMRGFMCGISPNYIHSMDAAHMANVIDKWNGDFGAVHDSFSTHAPDVELLLAHTKREFIDMYDKENFYKEIEHQLLEDVDDVIPNRPELGTLNIEEIQDSDYFFA